MNTILVEGRNRDLTCNKNVLPQRKIILRVCGKTVDFVETISAHGGGGIFGPTSHVSGYE